MIQNAGILFNWGATWIGAHYSPYNKRLCVNLIPCITIFIVFRGGKMPYENQWRRGWKY